jgi:hypothetical protein
MRYKAQRSFSGTAISEKQVNDQPKNTDPKTGHYKPGVG